MSAPRSVTPQRPCAVCHGHDGCSTTPDGLMLCRRRDGAQPGFRHLGPAQGDRSWHLYRREGDDRNGHHSATPRPSRPPLDWSTRADLFQRNLTVELRQELAQVLGVAEACILGLHVGYMIDDQGGAWTFPEQDGQGNFVGISRRWRDGRKRALPGGRRGLTIPDGWRDRPGPILLPEGASDVLALWSLNLCAVGRPSNMGGVDHLASLLHDLPGDRDIIVLGEHDPKPDGTWPGRDGARHTAQELARRLRRPVQWALPPGGAKDARAWLQAQADGAAADGQSERFMESLQIETIGTETETETETATTQPPEERQPVPDPDSPLVDNGFKNFFVQEIENEKGETKIILVGYAIQVLHAALQRLAGNWPKTANGMLFVEGPNLSPRWMKSSTETFAWIGGRLPTIGQRNGLQWMKGSDKVSEGQFHAFVVQNAEQYEAVEQIPHFPPMPNHYYMHPPLAGGGGAALRELLQRFNPATDADYDLIQTAFMTPFSGTEPGQRPAFLIQAEDEDQHGGRGTGKTTLAELVGRLCGGHVEMRSTDDWDRLVTRLLSPAALTKRVALLDNVKTLRFSWAELEAGITGAVISGRQLYVGEGRRPNTLTYFITLNGANLSKDMAQRCVPVVLKRPERYDAAWEEQTIALIETRRWEIIGDIIALLKAPAPALTKFSRWSTWERAVLSRVADPSECQKVIEERQAAIDEDQTEAEIVRDGFREELKHRGHNPDTEVIWIPSKVAAQIINRIENEDRRPTPRAIIRLYLMSIPELRRSNRAKARGCVWTGPDAAPDATAETIKPAPSPAYYPGGDWMK